MEASNQALVKVTKKPKTMNQIPPVIKTMLDDLRISLVEAEVKNKQLREINNQCRRWMRQHGAHSFMCAANQRNRAKTSDGWTKAELAMICDCGLARLSGAKR